MKPGNSPSDFAEVVHVQHTRPVIFGYIPGENEPSNSYAECRRQQRLVGMAEDYGTIGRRTRANRGIVVFGQLKERGGQATGQCIFRGKLAVRANQLSRGGELYMYNEKCPES